MKTNKKISPAGRKKIAAAIKARFQEPFARNTAGINSVTSQFYRALVKAVQHEDFHDYIEAMEWTYPLLHSLPKSSALRQQVVRVIDALEWADGDYPQATPEDKRLGRKFRAHYNKKAKQIAANTSTSTTAA